MLFLNIRNIIRSAQCGVEIEMRHNMKEPAKHGDDVCNLTAAWSIEMFGSARLRRYWLLVPGKFQIETFPRSLYCYSSSAVACYRPSFACATGTQLMPCQRLFFSQGGNLLPLWPVAIGAKQRTNHFSRCLLLHPFSVLDMQLASD